MLDNAHSRFATALSAANPTFALCELAQALKTEGMEQIAMYKLFRHYQQTTEADDPKYDAIVDNMDLIWGGPWAKGRDLFEQELEGSDLFEN